MLLDSGFDFAHPDPALAWEVFKRFASVPVDSGGEQACEELWLEAGDGNLAKGWPGYFDFVRFFNQYTEEGAVWHEMVTMHFSSAPSAPPGLRGSVHATDLNNLPTFFNAVESSKLFQMARAYSAWSFEVTWDTS